MPLFVSIILHLRHDGPLYRVTETKGALSPGIQAWVSHAENFGAVAERTVHHSQEKKGFRTIAKSEKSVIYMPHDPLPSLLG